MCEKNLHLANTSISLSDAPVTLDFFTPHATFSGRRIAWPDKNGRDCMRRKLPQPELCKLPTSPQDRGRVTTPGLPAACHSNFSPTFSQTLQATKMFIDKLFKANNFSNPHLLSSSLPIRALFYLLCYSYLLLTLWAVIVVSLNLVALLCLNFENFLRIQLSLIMVLNIQVETAEPRVI